VHQQNGSPVNVSSVPGDWGCAMEGDPEDPDSHWRNTTGGWNPWVAPQSNLPFGPASIPPISKFDLEIESFNGDLSDDERVALCSCCCWAEGGMAASIPIFLDLDEHCEVTCFPQIAWDNAVLPSTP
jgi:hypothetical protein